MRHFLAAIATLALMLGLTQSAGALTVPATPSLARPIVDQTKTLSVEQIDQLAKAINEGRGEKSYQLGVLMISSLKGEALEEYSVKVAREWGIGEKDKSNGVLLLIVKDERKLRIEVGDGLEGELTDAESGRIIRNTITPQFKDGKFFEGIEGGVASIRAQVEGRASADSDNEPVPWGEIISAAIFIVFFLISWLSAILGRSKSWWAGGVVGGVSGGAIGLLSGFALWAIIALPILIGGGLLLDFFVSRNYKQHAQKGNDASWWAGGGWLGGSGGSSSGGSFGGGGFSGGGSSGSW